MHVWEHEVTSLTKDEIMAAINDDSWQKFRLSLKGVATVDKLDKLDRYLWWSAYKYGEVSRTDQVRVDNYINALLRGGQLIRWNGAIIVQR